MNETSQYFFLYAAFAVFAILFSFLINGLFLRFSRNLGMRNIELPQIRWNPSQKPALGGISFYILFLVSVIFYLVIFNGATFFRNIQLVGVLSVTSLGFLMGLADDAYNTRPYLKFGVQFTCGLILLLTGTYIKWFDSAVLNYILTLFWVVGIMNSVNMLDNMDSITTNVSIFIVLSCLIVSVQKHPITDIYFVLMLGVCAGLMGFLFYNWNPSKMFMGDTGSQFLGAFLASIGIIYLWNPVKGADTNSIKQIIIVLIAFLLPIVDTSIVTINRLMRGQSPFVGGRDHTTHHLCYMGLSEKQVARLFITLSALSVIFIYFIFYKLDRWLPLHTFLFFMYFLFVFISLYFITKKYSKGSGTSMI